MSLTLLNINPPIPPKVLVRSSKSVPSAPSAEVREAASPVLFSGSPGDDGFRRISNATSFRDLTPPAQDRMQRVAFYLYETNPIAYRAVELMKDFVCGEGISLEADDDLVMEVIERFWNDPENNLDQNVPDFVRELSIFGEQLWYAPVNPISGQVKLFYIDPSWIDAVEYGTPAGLEGKALTMPIAVHLRRAANEREGRRLEVARTDTDPLSPSFGMMRGEAFYFAINKARSGSRGISDLFNKADWMDGYDQMLYSLMQQADALSRFIWDVTLKGATEDKITDWLKVNGKPPRSASVRAHNEQVTWSAVAPSIQAGDKSAAADVIRKTILAGFGFPEHWFAEGGNVNRATAMEMGDPTYKMLTSRQRLVRYMLEMVLQFAVDQAMQRGVLPPGTNRTLQVITPELNVRDVTKGSAALQQTAASVSTVVHDGLMDEETAARLIAATAAAMGVEVDPKEMLEKAKAEKAERRLDDFKRFPPLEAFGGDPSADFTDFADDPEKNKPEVPVNG